MTIVPASPHSDRHATLIAIGLAVITLAVFAPVISFQFINVDDNVYVINNDHIHQGLTLSSVVWAITALDAANWHPVTWLSHLLDVSLFGLNPHGHHATSLLIHILNVVLLFLVLRSLTGSLWKSAIVAALFAVHPLALESAAWIAERKNVLSTLFLLLTLWAYIAYTRKPGVFRYLLVAFVFSLGLMSKSMLVTLPFALLLLDYWPLERIGPKAEPNKSATALFISRCFEKLPLLVLSAGCSALTMKAQALDHEIKAVPFSSSVANGLRSYAIYLKQMVWPSKLAIFYPYRDRAVFSAPVLVSLVLIVSITVLVLWQIKRRPYFAVGWFWYLGTLVPVIGLVHVADLAHADRHTYAPLWGIFIAIVWGFGELAARSTVMRNALIAAAGLSIAALSLVTIRDIFYWHDAISIAEHSLAVTGPNCLMERSLGEALYNQGHIDEALQHLTISTQLQPMDTTLFDIGTIKFQQQKFDEATFYYRKALQYPSEAQTQAQIDNNLAIIEMQQGSTVAAENFFQRSIVLDPSAARHRVAYGLLLTKLGRYDDAIAQYEQALKAAPDALTYFSLGSALEAQHKLPLAAAAYRETLSLAPGFQPAQVRLETISAHTQN